MQTNIKHKSNGAFTIVELLVVIVVIGILAAITIVSYSGVTNKSRTAKNQSNARSVLSAASNVHAENGSYPDASADALAALNTGVTKLPSTLTVSNADLTAGETILYRVSTDGTGICVGYWDYSIATPDAAYLFSGTASVIGDCVDPTP